MSMKKSEFLAKLEEKRLAKAEPSPTFDAIILPADIFQPSIVDQLLSNAKWQYARTGEARYLTAETALQRLLPTGGSLLHPEPKE